MKIEESSRSHVFLFCSLRLYDLVVRCIHPSCWWSPSLPSRTKWTTLHVISQFIRAWAYIPLRFVRFGHLIGWCFWESLLGCGFLAVIVRGGWSRSVFYCFGWLSCYWASDWIFLHLPFHIVRVYPIILRFWLSVPELINSIALFPTSTDKWSSKNHRSVS